jgi:NADH-quinone oxidoreductase subunit A
MNGAIPYRGSRRGRNCHCRSCHRDGLDSRGGRPRIVCAATAVISSRACGSKIKDTAYEGGMLPVGEGSTRMSVKFYLVAMLFILFDIEVVFMYPWAVVYKSMLAEEATRNLILGSMVSFLGILFVGYIYAVKKRAFDWKS